jgi:hypothetical protein
MKKPLLFSVILMIFSLIVIVSRAQVDVTATTGTLSGSYTTLGGAFAKINDGTHKGTITITISDNTSESSNANLNASGSGSASYSSVTIQPGGGAARTISGSINGNLISLTGADNVTIDGLNSGGNSLTIQNQNTGSSAATITFLSDASNNTLTNLTILGSTTKTSGGVIFFSTATTTGNDNNTVSACNIGPYSTNLPYYCVYSSGSTTSGRENSENTITACNIYDYYCTVAGYFTSAGIYLYQGNTTWTLSNNNLYQTATRSPGSATVYAAIGIDNTAGNNFSITGNYIGGSASDHSGTTTYSGSATGGFVPIYVNAGSTTASSVQNNTISNLSVTFAGSNALYGCFSGIYISSSTKANVGNLTGNTIGSTTTNGAITIGGSTAAVNSYGIRDAGLSGGSISNNTISGITVNPATSGIFYGIYFIPPDAGTSVVDNNVIGSSTLSNSLYFSNTGNSITVYGLYISASSASIILTVSNNDVTGITSEAYAKEGRIIGMYVANSDASGTTSVSQNQVYNLSCNQNTSYIAQENYALTGMLVGGNATTNIAGNTIHTLKQVNTANTTNGCAIIGLYSGMNGTGTSIIEKNLIHSLYMLDFGAYGYPIYGINVQGGNQEFRNNMVVLGNKSDGTTMNSTPYLMVVNIASTSNPIAFYFNTFALVGTVTATATYGANCFNTGGSGYGALILKNNIIYCTRSMTTPGSNYCSCISITNSSTICNGTTSITTLPSNYTFDYNCYYYSGTATRLHYQGTTINTWKNYTRQEYNSIMSDPKLKTPSGSASTVDLHIDELQSTPVEGAGLAISGITTDYDGDTRSLLTPTDIGADAGNFTNYDVFSPGITYTPLSFKPGHTNDRTISGATFFDPHGIASGSLAPRIYYRKNTGTWYSSQGSYISGDATSAVYDLTISASAMGGLNIGDLVEYYVVAQENTGGYVGSYPTGVVATNVNTITTAPTTLFSYRAGGTMSGTYTIGTAQASPFNTIPNAFSAFNYAVLAGPVTLELSDPTYTLTATATINANSESSATNTLTIKPATGVSPTITGNFNSSLIQIYGADYVTIDGSNNGSTSQNLTLTNTYSSGTSGVPLNIANGGTCSGDGVTYSTFKNLIIIGGAIDRAYGIFIGGSPVSSGGNHDNNTITNNVIKKCNAGIYFYSSTTTSDNNIISNNSIGSSSGSEYVTSSGIYLTYVTATTVTGNTIFNLINTSGSKPVGIDCYTGCSTVIIEKNLIHSIRCTSAHLKGGTGISLISNSNTVRNNVIFNIGGQGSTTPADMITGIYNTGTSNLFYFNTVCLYGDHGGYSAAANTSAAFYSTQSTGVDVRNNIFHNQIDPQNSNTTAISYGIMLTAIPATINYNDYYAAGQNPFLGYYSGNKSTIETWRTATSQDGSSLNTNPSFANVGGTAAYSYATGASLNGLTVSGITTDYNGQTRAATPTMGAFEGNTTTWTGTVSTDWNVAGNWSFGAVPTSSVNIIVPNQTNDPVVNEVPATPAQANSITIESGAVLTIAAGKALTVNGTITNSNGTSGIVIESSASGTGSLLNNTASVGATINRYIPGLSTSWHFLSSPVASQAISPAFTASPSTTYDFFTWYEPSDVWVNFKNNTNNPTWTTANGSANFVTGRGYLVQYTGTGLTKQFQGNMNTGAVSYPLTISGTGIYATYNLAGNPYPCAIDWKAASGWTRSSLASSGGGTVMYIWNDASRNYGSFNSAGSSGTNGVTQYIPSGQGFFVKAASAGNLGMDDGIKVHSDASFLKDSPANILKLNVTGNGMTSSDEMVIEFGHPDATGGAEKMFSFDETAPSLYTIKDNVNYSIDFRGAPATLSIPVSFKAGSNGQYILTASQLESFSNITKITLEDKQAGKTQELTTQAVYQFSAAKGDNEARFILHFGGAFGTGETSQADRYQITSQDHQIMIHTSATSQEAGEAVLYNLTGQMIGKATLQGNGYTIIPAGNFTGYCLVRITAPEGIFCYKIFVGNK